VAEAGNHVRWVLIWKRKATRDRTGMLRTISKRTLDSDRNCVLASYTGRRHLDTDRNWIQDCHGKSNFQQEEDFFSSKLNLNWRKKPVKCRTWSTALCGAENWTVREVVRKCFRTFDIRCWRWMEKISWADCEKWRGVTKSRVGEEYHINSKKKEG